MTQKANTTYTKEQNQAIHESGHNILVSASAGSGKTMVLVERIMNKIINGTDITELLVVTFTKAAAREMKERIQHKIQENINNPKLSPETNRHLVRQLPLIGQANISTIHSFCTSVIKKYYYLIDMDPVFRMITDETEADMLKEDILDECIELKLEDEDPSFYQFLEMYSNTRNLDSVKELALSVYQFALSKPDYMEWINLLSEPYQVDKLSELSIYKRVIKENILNTLNYCIAQSSRIIDLTNGEEELSKFQEVFTDLISDFEALKSIIHEDRLDDFYQQINEFKFPSKPRKSSKWDDSLLEIDALVKDSYDNLKDEFKSIQEDYFSLEPAQQVEQLNRMKPIIESLIELLKDFHQKFTDKKAELQALDFNDLEHKTLEILSAEGQVAAKYYQNHFEELLIDEYQDINILQETILSSISKDRVGNRFMVGDVKQSIYGFRLAEPQLFIDKYNRFENNDSDSRIVLQKNFRSRSSVLDFINFIFKQVMDSELGEISYDRPAELNVGNLEFPEDETKHTEILVYESKETNDEELDIDESERIQTGYEGEFTFVAQKIIELIKSGYEVYDKKEKAMRPVKYSDIVLLTPTKLNNLLIQQQFQKYNIPVSMDSTENYFQRTEIMTIMSLLKIIDNPLQDIPLVAVLRSPIVGLKEPELAEIRLVNRSSQYYQAVIEASQTEDDHISSGLRDKLTKFLDQLNEWRNYSKFNSLVDLIWKIYKDTNYLEYVGGLTSGAQRQSNLHALYERAARYEKGAFKGLFQFIKFIERMQKKDQDLAEPSKVTDQDNAVRVMTIHKSKGLEFPIVFLCNTSKAFNVQDAQGAYSLDNDEGFGSDFIDINQYIKYPTWVNEGIKQKRLNKLISEEMRVLYVALTRAEQKLFIVGSADSKEDAVNSWLAVENHNEITLPITDRLKHSDGFLGWIGKSLIRHPLSKELRTSSDSVVLPFQDINFEFLFKNSQELIEQEQILLGQDNNELEQSSEEQKIERAPDVELVEAIKDIIEYQYPNRASTVTTSFQSVSEIKRLFEDPEDDKLVKMSISDSGLKPNRYVVDDLGSPKFKETKQKEISPAEVGSATHLVMQKLDFSEPISEKIIESTINTLVSTEVLEETVANEINKDSIIQFTESSLGQLIQDYHDKLRREVPFSLLLEARDLFDEITSDDDHVLIHGIIDGFIILDNKIMLFDYKTDTVNYLDDPEAELVKRYTGQLTLYRKALETIYPNYEVQDVYIYSLDLNKAIKLS